MSLELFQHLNYSLLFTFFLIFMNYIICILSLKLYNKRDKVGGVMISKEVEYRIENLKDGSIFNSSNKLLWK